MTAFYLEWIVGFLYLLLGPVVWGVLWFAMFKGRQRMSLLVRPGPDLPSPPPHVTILIPAKDEGARIADCLRSAVAQDYPSFDVIAIDDRSKDQTGQVMDQIERESNGKLRALHIQDGELPPGWTGKCNALHRAVEVASGSWLLFVDSDVILEPDALRATIAVAAKYEFDLLSFSPRMEGHTLLERVVVPLAGGAMGVLYLIALTNVNELKGIAFAIGQFLCIRRDVYDQVGGHAAVRDQFCEDVRMAQLLKAKGFRPRLAIGTDFAAVRMYDSFGSMLRGWGRNFAAISTGFPWRIILGVFVVLVCSFSLFVAVPWGIYRELYPASFVGGKLWLATAAAHLIMMVGAVGRMYQVSGNRFGNAFLAPIGAVVLLVIFGRAIWMRATGRIVWRGTAYQREGAHMPEATPLR